MTTQQYLKNLNLFYQIEYVCENSCRGGQHVQKGVKVQKDIELSYEDIFHYNKNYHCSYINRWIDERG